MLQIKQADINDIPVIQDLTYKIWPDTYGQILSPAQLKYMLELFYSVTALKELFTIPGYNFIISYENQIPVGFAAYAPKEPGSAVYKLHKLYILPAMHGRGTGKALVSYLINDIQKKGCHTLELNVNRHNKALHFYNKLGFKVIREEDIDIGQGYYMNDFIMQKMLNVKC